MTRESVPGALKVRPFWVFEIGPRKKEEMGLSEKMIIIENDRIILIRVSYST